MCLPVYCVVFLTPRSPKAHPILTLEAPQIQRAENQGTVHYGRMPPVPVICGKNECAQRDQREPEERGGPVPQI